MEKVLRIISLSLLLIGCATSNETVTFKNSSVDTGIYESDPDGDAHTVLGDSSKVYYLMSTASIPAKEFATLTIDNEFCNTDICVAFQLTEKGTKEYAELTKRNLDKQIFYVIDGSIISDPIAMGQIRSGMGQFPIKEIYFDTLFTIK